MTAISPKYSGRLPAPATVEGHGEDELTAPTDLAVQLRELRDVDRRMAVEEKKRATFYQRARRT